jgi:hypothetical protein
MHKVDYLVYYDYGQGGLWGFIEARSVQDISAKYPELLIFPEPPPFYSKAQLDMIAANLTTDLDDEPKGWLKEMVERRKKTP